MAKRIYEDVTERSGKMEWKVFESDEALLELVRDEILERLDRELETASEKSRTLLLGMKEAILSCRRQETLFPFRFGARQLQKGQELPPRAVEIFQKERKRSPAAYMKDCRIAAARELLQHRDLKIWRIARFAGYSGLQPFDRAFQKAIGLSPRAFRETSPRRRRRSVAADESSSEAFWIHATLGILDEVEHERLLERLRLQAFPDRTGESSPQAPLFRLARARPKKGAPPAERHEGGLRDLAAAELRAWIRELVLADPPELVRRIGDEIRRWRRRDPDWAFELAETALEHLDANATALGDEASRLGAWLLAWQANLWRCAGDTARADDLFRRARKSWERAGRDLFAEAELCDLEAALRTMERRFEEALRLLARSISLARIQGDSDVLVRSLLQRASILAYTGSAEATIPDLQLALEVLDDVQETYLHFAAWSHLSTAYALAGRHEKALETLPRARELVETTGSELVRYQLDWTEGLARHGLGEVDAAERLFLEARAGFIDLAARENAALVSLDLAILYHERGRHLDASRLASEAVPVLEALGITGEAVAAAEVLRQSIAANEVALADLRTVRALFRGYLADPARRPGAIRSGRRRDPGRP